MEASLLFANNDAMLNTSLSPSAGKPSVPTQQFIKEFVAAAHGNLPPVKQILKTDPNC
jgi:hypothetical protein